MVERRLHKKCHSATVGSNPGAIWRVNRLEEETPCRNSHCRMPGLSSDGFIIFSCQCSIVLFFGISRLRLLRERTENHLYMLTLILLVSNKAMAIAN